MRSPPSGAWERQNGKIAGLAVHRLLCGEEVENKNAMSNPEILETLRTLPELRKGYPSLLVSSQSGNTSRKSALNYANLTCGKKCGKMSGL